MRVTIECKNENKTFDNVFSVNLTSKDIYITYSDDHNVLQRFKGKEPSKVTIEK